jgi:hypothetical protein
MPRGRPLEVDGELLEAFRHNGSVNMMAYLMQHDAHHGGQICWRGSSVTSFARKT